MQHWLALGFYKSVKSLQQLVTPKLIHPYSSPTADPLGLLHASLEPSALPSPQSRPVNSGNGRPNRLAGCSDSHSRRAFRPITGSRSGFAKDIFLLQVGSLLISLSFKHNENFPWSHPLVWATMVSFVLFTTAFVYVEARVSKEPVMPMRLLTRRSPLCEYLRIAIYLQGILIG
jgi:hypothetical protein